MSQVLDMDSPAAVFLITLGWLGKLNRTVSSQNKWTSAPETLLA